MNGVVLSIFKDFFENGKFVKSLNSTFIVIMLKKGGTEDKGLQTYQPYRKPI